MTAMHSLSQRQRRRTRAKRLQHRHAHSIPLSASTSGVNRARGRRHDRGGPGSGERVGAPRWLANSLMFAQTGLHLA
jgi:hypothetical protein